VDSWRRCVRVVGCDQRRRSGRPCDLVDQVGTRVDGRLPGLDDSVVVVVGDVRPVKHPSAGQLRHTSKFILEKVQVQIEEGRVVACGRCPERDTDSGEICQERCNHLVEFVIGNGPTTSENTVSSTAAIASSVLECRTLYGRRYHSDRVTDNEYWYCATFLHVNSRVVHDLTHNCASEGGH